MVEIRELDTTRVVPGTDGDRPGADPRQAAVAFMTTEHFTLQGARAATVAESNGRATMFLGAVSGGLVTVGLIATASHVGTAFYAFGLILLPALAFIGMVTCERVVQSGTEDYGYARRIALLRGYYFDQAQELSPCLPSVPPEARHRVQGLWDGRWPGGYRDWLGLSRTAGGMIAVITALLAGSFRRTAHRRRR